APSPRVTRGEDPLSRRLRTPPLPATHAAVGNPWPNRGLSQSADRCAVRSATSGRTSAWIGHPPPLWLGKLTVIELVHELELRDLPLREFLAIHKDDLLCRPLQALHVLVAAVIVFHPCFLAPL